MMVERSHAEDPLTGELESTDLDYHGECFQHEHGADDRQQ